MTKGRWPCLLGPALIVALAAGTAPAQPAPEPSAAAVVEIRSYTLKKGMRDRFHALVVHEALPLLQRWKIDVVAYGPSQHDEDSYFLMRAFASVHDRVTSEDAFYGSGEWRDGPRAAVLGAIDTYTTVVVAVDPATLAALRRLGPRRPAAAQEETHMSAASDLAALTALNDDYIRAVQTSDAARFGEILAPDFLCSNPDGSLFDREAFLDAAARPVTITNLRAADVNVRLLGDTAIVHAQTTFTHADGRPGRGRYTDVWARRDGRWLAVAAHVTRVAF